MRLAFWKAVPAWTVLLFLVLPAAAALPQIGGGFTKPLGPLRPSVDATVCTHTGAQWIPPRVVDSGASQCIEAEFELDIGVNELGAQVSVSWNGCPAFIETEPGHGKKVQKLHHNAVDKQRLSRKIQHYTADCGGLLSPPSCVAEGPPVLPGTFVNHWQEEGCDYAQ